VEVAKDGVGIKTDAEDWPFNPPLVELFDPQLPEEIGRERVRAGMAAAQWEDESRDP
jgi:hypothetical protein